MDSSFSGNEILVIITMGIMVMLLMALALGLFFYFSQKKFQAQQIEAQQQELDHNEELLFNSIKAQEEERQRIARELHDAVGSKLNVINLGLHRLQKASDSMPGITESVAELFSTVGSTINTTRRISHDLLPPTLENFGLPVALDELCNSAQSASGITVQFELCEVAHITIDNSHALGIFRIVQELMSNSFKYAEASQIEVKLWQGLKEIRLTYQDNGKGFDTSNAEHQKGMGLRNIESRARMLRAEYQLKSAPKKGVFFQLKKQLS